MTTALSRCFDRAATRPLGGPPPLRGAEGIAIDGKAQRGRLAFDRTVSSVHALRAVAHQSGRVPAQLPIAVHSDKAEAELIVAPTLIARLDWQGRVFTGDALFGQRKLCEQIVQAGGGCLLIVKDNQPTLPADLCLLFDPPPHTPPLTGRREAVSRDDGHGRHRAVCRLAASTGLTGYSDWPGLAQVWRWERQWQEQDPAKREVRYGITSLPPAVADAARLLELKRGYWVIENGLHYVKAVTLGEDRSLVHLGAGPMVMSILWDTALNLLRCTGHTRIASRLRYHRSHPQGAVALVRAQNA